MFKSTKEALEALRTHRPEEPEYMIACQHLVAHKTELTQRVFIDMLLPDQAIINGSMARCNCGVERVIVPEHLRTDFQPSAAGSVVVSAESPVYLKPIGGDKRSAYLVLRIEQGALTFLQDPCAPFVLTADLFGSKGYRLDELEKVIAQNEKPPIWMQGIEKDVRVPVFAINTVDAQAGTVTITPDIDVESFDPEALPDHACE